MQRELLENMYRTNELDELLKESDYTTRRRKECQQMVESLGRASEIVSQVQWWNSGLGHQTISPQRKKSSHWPLRWRSWAPRISLWFLQHAPNILTILRTCFAVRTIRWLATCSVGLLFRCWSGWFGFGVQISDLRPWWSSLVSIRGGSSLLRPATCFFFVFVSQFESSIPFSFLSLLGLLSVFADFLPWTPGWLYQLMILSLLYDLA